MTQLGTHWPPLLNPLATASWLRSEMLLLNYWTQQMAESVYLLLVSLYVSLTKY